MNLSKFISIIELVGPLVLTAVNPAFAFIASDVVALIKRAQVSGATGQEKLASVVAAVPQVIADLNTAHGSVLVDPTLASTALEDGVNAVIAVTKLIQNPKAVPVATAVLNLAAPAA